MDNFEVAPFALEICRNQSLLLGFERFFATVSNPIFWPHVHTMQPIAGHIPRMPLTASCIRVSQPPFGVEKWDKPSDCLRLCIPARELPVPAESC